MRLVLAVAAALALAAPAHAIVGGRPATRPYPYAAQLALDGGFICGAGLVHREWVLTAAHCVEDGRGNPVEPRRVELRLGRTRLSEAGGEVRAAAEVRMHPRYDGTSHDLALVRLAAPSGQEPIRIVSPGQRGLWAPGTSARVIGWGAQLNGGPVSDGLREVDVTVRSDATCATSANAVTGYDPATLFCAGEQLGGRDSCQGDSGGPLMVPDAAGILVAAGVVSQGVGCALPMAYGLYSRVGEDPLARWAAEQLPRPGVSPSPAVRVRRVGRLRVRGKRVRLGLRASAPVTAVRVRVRRGGRLVARGGARRLEGRRTLVLRRVRPVRRGAHRVIVRATDAGGERRVFRLRARR
jgi:secreted trypsin-like serine protease